MIVLTAVGAISLFATGGALAVTPQSPGPEPGSPEQMEYFADTCRHELQRPPTQWSGVENVTTPGPGTIVAGDVVDISLQWNPADWTDTWVEKVLNCVSIDGTPVPELSDEERPAPNDGVYSRELVVPADIESGHLLCQQGFVYGMFTRGGYTLTSSPRVCFTTEAAPPPPPPTTTTTEPPPPPPAEPPTTTTTEPPAPSRVAAAAPEPAPVPVPVRTLPKTGSGDRMLLLGAGGALALGGFGVAAGRKRRAS
jgi:LPXTG-motif cell wall-anchored protein